jgi:hypothetical protein
MHIHGLLDRAMGRSSGVRKAPRVSQAGWLGLLLEKVPSEWKDATQTMAYIQANMENSSHWIMYGRHGRRIHS